MLTKSEKHIMIYEHQPNSLKKDNGVKLKSLSESIVAMVKNEISLPLINDLLNMCFS